MEEYNNIHQPEKAVEAAATIKLPSKISSEREGSYKPNYNAPGPRTKR